MRAVEHFIERDPRVLVILAAFNGARWIREQLESIVSQTGVQVDLIVSDDWSSDATAKIVKDFARTSRLTLVSPPSPTGSAAQNFLWLICNTPCAGYRFVALADQDDIWHHDKLSLACAALVASYADGYSCSVQAFWADGKFSTLHQPARRTCSDYLFEGAGQGCTFVLTNTFFDRLRGFFSSHSVLTHGVHYHDWTIYALSRAWQLTWVFDRRVLLRYRQHSFNDTGARFTWKGIAKRLRLLSQGWYARQLLEIAGICREAAPESPTVARWHALLASPRSLSRKREIAAFCLRGGRRRISDNAMVLLAVLAGWI